MIDTVLSDTICYPTDEASFYVKHAEKYFIVVDLLDEKDTIIQAYIDKDKEKDKQLGLANGVIQGLSGEVKRLKTINILLGISTGALIIGLLAVLL